MQLLWKIFKRDHLDANIDECGIEIGTLQSKYEYIVTKPAVLHIVTSGTGTLVYNDKIYQLYKGDIFLLQRGMHVLYYASSHDPWTYYWVGFSGKLAMDFLNRTQLVDTCVIQNEDTTEISHLIYQMCQRAVSYNISVSDDISLLSELYRLLSLLHHYFPRAFKVTHNEMYKTVREAIQYMHQNYMKSIKVQDISRHVNVSRSYLYKIFMKNVDQSPQQYLIQLRMYHAARLIKETDKQNQEIAYLVGYKDPLRFAKSFKKHLGITATDYRKKFKSSLN